MAVEDVTIRQAAGLKATPAERPAGKGAVGATSTGQLADSVELSSKDTRPTQVQQTLRIRVNQAIEATNVASGAVENISRLVGGIEGILEQMTDGEVPPPRVAKLEEEARSLRDEIVKAAQTSTSGGVKPLAGDPIRVELEQTLGKALEVILPDDATRAFDIGDIDFSQKELILDIVTKVQQAKKGLESLKGKVEDGSSSVQSTVMALEVAFENAEASRSSLREVEDALDLARDTKVGIKENPQNALDSVGRIVDGSATKLLRD